MLISEILNSKVDVKFEQRDPLEYHASSTIGGKHILFRGKSRDGLSWEVDFLDEDEENYFGVTGKGDQYKIFTMVKICFEDFLKTYDNPININFSAAFDGANGSRPEVYQRMLKRDLPSFYSIVKFPAEGKIYFRLINQEKLKSYRDEDDPSGKWS